MKKLTLTIFIVLMTISFSLDSYAWSKPRPPDNAVGAPLDGGLLTILGLPG